MSYQFLARALTLDLLVPKQAVFHKMSFYLSSQVTNLKHRPPKLESWKSSMPLYVQPPKQSSTMALAGTGYLVPGFKFKCLIFIGFLFILCVILNDDFILKTKFQNKNSTDEVASM